MPVEVGHITSHFHPLIVGSPIEIDGLGKTLAKAYFRVITYQPMVTFVKRAAAL